MNTVTDPGSGPPTCQLACCSTECQVRTDRLRPPVSPPGPSQSARPRLANPIDVMEMELTRGSSTSTGSADFLAAQASGRGISRNSRPTPHHGRGEAWKSGSEEKGPTSRSNPRGNLTDHSEPGGEGDGGEDRGIGGVKWTSRDLG